MIKKKTSRKNFTQTFFSLFSLSWVLISSPHFLPRPHHHHLHLHFLRRCWPRNRQPSFSEKDQKTKLKWGKTDKKQTREIKATGQTIEVYSWNNVVWILQLFEDYFPFVRRNIILCFFWFFCKWNEISLFRNQLSSDSKIHMMEAKWHNMRQRVL